MKCNWELCELCTNEDCPIYDDYCPYDRAGVCKYEDITEED